MSNKKPIVYAIYKKQAAAQFTPMTSFYECSVCSERNYNWPEHKNSSCTGKMRPSIGAILLTIGQATGEKVYDWTNGVRFAIGLVDIPKILIALKGERLEIFHDSNKGRGPANPKKLMLMPGKDGSMFLGIQHTTGKTSLPISAEEIIIIKELLTRAITLLLMW